MASIPTADAEQTFEIISSLRYDPSLPQATLYNSDSYPDPQNSPYYLLAYHRDRLAAAARHFGWENASKWLQQDLESFERFLDESIPDRSKPWRLRIAVDINGKGSVDVNPTAAFDPFNLLTPSLHAGRPSHLWRVYVDSQPTLPSGFTTHKTTARNDYTAARLRAGITSPAETSEVLVINPRGEIMEGSITTPYFRRRGPISRLSGQDSAEPAWITPPLSSGGNAGTSRRYALSQGFCVEEVIPQLDLVDGEECWLSNGVRGFMLGVVVLGRQAEKQI
jgi:branched-subunit amino acid aminotransferase/4-amino-4-deoxychorismate lyase